MIISSVVSPLVWLHLQCAHLHMKFVTVHGVCVWEAAAPFVHAGTQWLTNELYHSYVCVQLLWPFMGAFSHLIPSVAEHTKGVGLVSKYRVGQWNASYPQGMVPTSDRWPHSWPVLLYPSNPHRRLTTGSLYVMHVTESPS